MKSKTPASKAPSYQRKQGRNPTAVVGVHYSPVCGLTHLNPGYSGSATPERGRLLRSVGKDAPQLAQKVSFYVRCTARLPSHENMISGANAYEVRLPNVYDAMTDLDGIIDRNHGNGSDRIIRAILRAGYDGVIIDGMATDERVVTLYGRGNIPVLKVN